MKVPAPNPDVRRRICSTAGFTLIEVILAIGIVVSLLIVALLFYRQAADLRNQILAESERCSTVRLLLDRLAADLREALPEPDSGHEFVGESGSLSFVRPTLAMPNAGATPGLTRVTYAAVIGNEGTNQSVIGFDRTEGPPRQRRTAFSQPNPTNSPTTSIVVPAAFESAPTNRMAEPLTELIHFVRFRYWDGAQWLTGWTNSAPPPGVEIVLATDAPTEGSVEPLESDTELGMPDEYPLGAFRRVVFLPAGTPVRSPEAVADELLSPP